MFGGYRPWASVRVYQAKFGFLPLPPHASDAPDLWDLPLFRWWRVPKAHADALVEHVRADLGLARPAPGTRTPGTPGTYSFHIEEGGYHVCRSAEEARRLEAAAWPDADDEPGWEGDAGAPR